MPNRWKPRWNAQRNRAIKVRTVGLDGSLQLEVETTIPTKWTEKLSLKGAILQQKIRIPLRGTLAQPKLDEAVMREHIKNLAKAAGRNLLRDQFENFLPKRNWYSEIDRRDVGSRAPQQSGACGALRARMCC